jgi:hypothetical protein
LVVASAGDNLRKGGFSVKKDVPDADVVAVKAHNRSARAWTGGPELSWYGTEILVHHCQAAEVSGARFAGRRGGFDGKVWSGAVLRNDRG